MYLNAKSELSRTRHLELRASTRHSNMLLTVLWLLYFNIQTRSCFCDLDIRPWPRYYDPLPAYQKWTF